MIHLAGIDPIDQQAGYTNALLASILSFVFVERA
jgi:hypothetical protein